MKSIDTWQLSESNPCLG